MNDIELQKLLFHPVCNQTEIERVFNVQNATDHLLKLRAETIVDHMRLYRVYRNMALRDEKNWSLEGAFSDRHYRAVLAKLPKDALELCRIVTYGDIFSNDPNGMIFPTPFGPITTISESLKYFLRFSHLAVLDYGEEVPRHIRINSLRIAIRVMLKTEALDFYMDPRGIIPPKVATAIYAPIPIQMKFIAGHELSHFVLGHLSDGNLVDQPIFHAISGGDKEYKPTKVYNSSQRNELEADLQAILLPRYSQQQRNELLHAALLWFGCLELYQAAINEMFPLGPCNHQSHPTARDRYENLLTNIPTAGLDSRHWKQYPKLIEELTAYIQEDISLNIDAYEGYGSAYLDAPNTEWRGRELVDRVDYY